MAAVSGYAISVPPLADLGLGRGALATERGLPLAVIRAGTSRGVFFRERDLPPAGPERAALILRVFGGSTGQLVDGLGGQSPLLRKVAVVDHQPSGPDGLPVLTYGFAQVGERLTGLDVRGECGNIAAGVPLFASMHDWCDGPWSRGSVWIHLTNTGKRVRADWLSGTHTEGTLRLSFFDPALASPGYTEEAQDGLPRYTVVRALTDCVLVDARDLGIPDPAARVPSAAVLEIVDAVARRACAQLLEPRRPKVCLFVPVAGRPGALRARVIYPRTSMSHPSFPVSVAVGMAVATGLPGSIAEGACGGVGDDRTMAIGHPSGELVLGWTPRADGLPARVDVTRASRLILSGHAY